MNPNAPNQERSVDQCEVRDCWQVRAGHAKKCLKKISGIKDKGGEKDGRKCGEEGSSSMLGSWKGGGHQ